MSVHSQSAAPYAAAATPEFPRHVVTAVLVAHDGARWLPDALAGLLGQERPVQNIVAADTGSADDSARLVTEALGAERVLHLARRTSFGTAVDEATRTAGVLTPEDLPYLKRPSSWDPVSRSWRDDAYDLPELPHGEPVQWLWLLHDDCAPEPDALAELLRVVDTDPHAAIVGPKLRGWYDRKQLLEVGVSIANSGRRWTGLDRREQDQGQHDQVRTVLSVSTAGMLIRRDIWEELGGFDRRLPLMRDDVDLCWRAHTAGHRVLVAPDAVLRHAEASARERRPIDCAGRSVSSPHRVDKAGAVYTMLVNARAKALPWVMLRLVVGTLLRTLAYLVGKVPGQALDEVAGFFGTLLRPGRILSARRSRGKGAVDQTELRGLFPPPGATVRATVDQVAGNFGSSEADSGGSRHGAVESGPGGDDADFLEIEQFARLKRVGRKPGPVLFALLLLVSLVACRGLLGGGALAGGALLPAPADVSDLWSKYADGWHTVGTGGTQTAPPYLAVLSALSALFLGSTGFALTLLLVCSVPLAGLTAYFVSRPLLESRLLRAWASVAYAFLPAATGALATGRLGTAVLAVLLPLIARAAVSAHGMRASGDARGSWRATWAYTLLLTFAMAFTPIVWPLAVVLGIGVLALRRDDIAAYGLRFLAAIGTPLLVLAPWSLSLLTSPSGFLKEAGLDIGTGTASALDLLGISPGGPKAAGGVLLLGIVLAALAALLRGERQFAVRTAWAVALVALVFAALANGSGWAGPATLVYGIALIVAALVGADGARIRVAELSFGWRQPVAALIALAAGLAPALAAVGWMIGGAAGPLERRDPVQVPAFVAEESTTRDQPRTLVLGGTSPASVSYSLVRGSGARLGDAELTEAGGSNSHLDKVVANLVAGSGADQGSQLSGFAIRYVLVRDGAPKQMSRVLDATPGLSRLSQLDGSALWRVDRQVARVMIMPSGTDGEPLPVGSLPVEAHSKIPAGGSGRVLRIADAADPGWQATLDGRPLTRKTVDGWAQGFELPAEGGTLDLTYDTPFTHTAWIWAQSALAVVLLVLALPGRRREIDDDLPEETVPVPAEPVAGEGRRARRLRAAAQAEAEAGAEAEQSEEAPEAQGQYIPSQQTEEYDPAQQTGEYAPARQTPDQQIPDQQIPDQQIPGQQPHQADDGQAAYAPQTDDGQYAAVPQQQYGEWDAQQYQDTGYQQYQDGQYQGEQYQDGQYGTQQNHLAADPYQQNAYDPYGYAQQQYDPQAQAHAQAPYDPQAQYGQQAQYDPQNPDENPAPGQNPWPTGNASRGESE
ncbi:MULTISPECIES: glycosyltransferase [unclassified Streptomyces]|uniref:glycosyltransferase n=1 Tax=unclassified Streptomyces TaxID=2593676 RepID=UPI000F5BEC54|nr:MULTISPECIES: glycosyltransferase [unclassified Streptomyces]RPK57983.1 Glycosyl transferase family 2 [Streptomyces sp. ADI95-17]WSG51188.1 glycosyltransferase [Streptomyces sp. NBC_01732]WSP48705.1 glycosyltransferase [Streptomyces sp. NBC_01243]